MAMLLLLYCAALSTQPASTNVKEDFTGTPPLPEDRPAMVGHAQSSGLKIALASTGRRESAAVRFSTADDDAAAASAGSVDNFGNSRGSAISTHRRSITFESDHGDGEAEKPSSVIRSNAQLPEDGA